MNNKKLLYSKALHSRAKVDLCKVLNVKGITMIRYIPPYILSKYEKNEFNGCLNGFILLFDIADFTKTGNYLQDKSNLGAQEISNYISAAFEDSIEIILRNGGFISVFAGDAFCAVFPEGNPDNILSAACLIQARLKSNSNYSCCLGNFDIKARITVCYGNICWEIFRNNLQCEYIFYGVILHELAEVASYKNEISFSKSAAEYIGMKFFTPVGNVYKLNIESHPANPHEIVYKYSEFTLEKFIHPRFISTDPENEIRHAAYCFVSLKKILPEKLEETIEVIHILLDHYGGLMNKLDATDKGVIGLIIFGSPKSDARILHKMSRFALKIIAELPDVSIGLASGFAYSGYTGGRSIKEYTSLGRSVNLAARLMMDAGKGEILTDHFLYSDIKSQFQFVESGKKLNLKGFLKPVEVHHLEGYIQDSFLKFNNKFVGRDQELHHILDLLKSHDNELVMVEGVKGAGKSRLISEAVMHIEDYQMEKVYLNELESIAPYNVLRLILDSYFHIVTDQNISEMYAQFKRSWNKLCNFDENGMKHESIVYSLVNPNALPSCQPFESTDKVREIISAFRYFTARITEDKPVMFVLDKAELIDAESLHVISHLESDIENPIKIICTCEKGEIFDLLFANFNSFSVSRIKLKPLTSNETSEMIKSMYQKQEIDSKTLKFIHRRSGGIPSSVERLADIVEETRE